MHLKTVQGQRLWLLTVTAPGVAPHKRWSPRQVYVRGARRPVCPCHEGVALADWNPSAGACWNRLLTALRERLPDLDFYRVSEVQDRGALHHHVILATPGSLDVLEVQALALAAGYGCQTDLVPVDVTADVRQLGSYVSKQLSGYVSKGSGAARQSVPWRRDVADRETGEIRRLHTTPTYKTHTQSRSWGCTQRQIMAERQRQARARAIALLSHAQSLTGPDEWPTSTLNVCQTRPE
jgi:hypothetical protein